MQYHKTANDIFNYWKALCVEGQPPLRSSVSPAQIRSALPDLFMLEAGEDDALRFRLAGTRVCTLFSRELRGMPFASLWAAEQASNAEDLANAVLQYACPFLINVTGFTHDGVAQRFELLLLPLRSSGEQCDRLMGALMAQSSGAFLPADTTLGGLHIDRSRPLADIGKAIRAGSRAREAV